MLHDPAHIRRLLAQAREIGQWDQDDAAALCFDALALQPDCFKAAELVYELFCDPWLVYDMRNALQQNHDEWDDRPWIQRQRLTSSFRRMSQWVGWEQEYTEGYEDESDGPDDVEPLLKRGASQVVFAYCIGDEECADFAWPIFREAFGRTHNPHAALLWAGKCYIHFGFFSDAVEVLAELCARFKDERVHRLLVEVRWWRDHAERIPWLPPRGDGSRYRRMMAFIDPNAVEDMQQLRAERAETYQADRGDFRPSIEPELAELVAAALPEWLPEKMPTPVDWSFLDTDDGQPGELPEWVEEMMKLLPERADDIAQRHRWSRPIKPPATPRHYKPEEDEETVDLTSLDLFFDADDDSEDEE